jgi:Family of unknown function (DUF5522)
LEWPRNMTDDVIEEEPDYYFENGLMVFTSTFLKRRGFCCRSGCRHCPYGFKKEEEAEG